MSVKLVKLSSLRVSMAAVLLFSAGAAIAAPATIGSSDESKIRNLLDAQATDWNRGDIESFVKGYWKSDDTLFVGAGGVKRGWQSILDRYRHDYPDRKTMGHLAFSNLEVHVTCPDSAYAIGVFELQRASGVPVGKPGDGHDESKLPDQAVTKIAVRDDAKLESMDDSKSVDKEVIRGYFTLYLRKFAQQWQIVADHTTRAQSPTVSGSKFAELSDRFLKDSLALSPSAASQVGYHKHVDVSSGKTIVLDELLDDMSLAGMMKQRDFYAQWQKRFHAETPLATLDPEDAADWQLIDDQIALQLLEFDKIQNYRHNPTIVVELIGSALFRTLTEDYAPKDERLGHALSRMRQIPVLLDQVKRYLVDVDPIFITTAIEENDGNVDLIKDTLAKEIPDGSARRKEYDELAPQAIKSLQDFSKWLHDDLASRKNHRSWCLGKEWYDEKFKLVMEVDVTPAQVLADAEQQMRDVRLDMLRLALPLHKQMYPTHDDHSNIVGIERENLIIGEVLKRISDDRPKREQLQAAIEADLGSIVQFIKDHKIVSMKSRDNLKVVPTPLFERGALSVAAFHSAPALNPSAQAEYWVTPIESSVSDVVAESKLREYNNYTLKWLTIHEALPGHYVQFEHLNDLQPERRRLLRSLYSNGPYVEGWAEYIAQVMMDEGFLDHDPRFRLVMRKIRLRVLSNAVLDIKMHTMHMTDAQAMELMTKQAFQTQAEAAGKLKRAKLSSTQLPTYWVGLSQWLAFRKNYQEKLGQKFNLMKFHDAALDEGPLPVPAVEKLLLKRVN